MKVSLRRKWNSAQGINNFSDVLSKFTTNRCATINVNGHGDHNYILVAFSWNENSSIGPLIWRWRKCKSFDMTCGTNVEVSNVSLGFKIIHIFIFYSERIGYWYFMGVFNKTIVPLPRPGYGILLYWPTRHHYRQVSNAPSSEIIVDYCVFNSMQHQMNL